jgi:hypothetical protein
MKLNNTDYVRTAVRKAENGFIIEVWSGPHGPSRGDEYVAIDVADLDNALLDIFNEQRRAIVGFFGTKPENYGRGGHDTPTCKSLMGYGLDGVVEK